MAQISLPPYRHPGSIFAGISIVLSLVVELWPEVGAWLLLVPQLMSERFFLWQPLTFGFIQSDPSGLIIGGLMLWVFGAQLLPYWGRNKMILMLLGVATLSGFLTWALAFLVSALNQRLFAGQSVFVSVLTVGFALKLKNQPINFWGFTVTGYMLFIFFIATMAISGVFSGWAVIPTVFAVALTALESRLSFTFKPKRHLRPLDGGKNIAPSGSDKYKQ